MGTATRFGVLGPVQLLADGRPAAIGPAKQRALLAALLLRANHIAPVDELIDLLWADDPPRTARKNIQVYVSHLRQIVGARLTSCPPGYRLSVAPGELDLDEFETRLASARAARRAGRLHQAASEYQAAMRLWRGAPLADVAGIGRLGEAAARLDRLRLPAYEDRIDVELELGRHAGVLPLLDELVAAHPLYERFAEQQILALSRAGRRADALEAYDRCRQRLAQELGVEPGTALQRLARSIRAVEPYPGLALAPAADPALRQLPAAVAAFTGREAELAELRDGLCTRQGYAIAVWVLTGPAGAGKSALAVQAAHQVSHAFPDGQLYADLHGATAGLRPLPTIEVLGRFLRLLGVDDRAVPPHADEAATLLRSRLADRRMLMVLDNAHDAAQVRPLIPAGTECAVLITARRSLAELETAHHVEVGALPEADALRLLKRLAGEPRISAEAGPAGELIRWSGGLPLALRIAGARLRSRPQWTVAVLAARLRDERHRLSELRLGDIAIRTSFMVSYEHLHDPAAGRLFRLLGAFDAPEMSTPTACALLDQPPRAAQDALDELVDARLLDEARPGRYTMHDLIRLFARELADQREPAAERERAVGRALRHYLSHTRHALTLLCPGSRLSALDGPNVFTDSGTALSWLDTERRNVVAAVLQATASPGETVARTGVELADILYLYFHGHGHTGDWIATDRAAIAAAHRLGDHTTEARLLHDLAVAHFYLHRMDEAAQPLGESLRLSRECGDEDGQARALNQFGIMAAASGDYARAAGHLIESLRLRERLGDMRACAATQGNIAMVYRLAGQHGEALRFGRASARLARREGAPEIEANALGVLGEVYRLTGRHDTALRCLRRSFAVRGTGENERTRGSMMSTLAEAYLDAGRVGQAIRHAELAVEAFGRAGFRHGEAVALRRLGQILCGHGNLGRGTEQLRAALAIFTALDAAEAEGVRSELDKL